MKILIVLLPLLFQIALTNQNYANPGDTDTATNTFMTGNCNNAPAGFIKSPILIEDSLCTPYGEFKLVMDDDTATGGAMSSNTDYVTPDATTGAVLRSGYNSASLTFNGSTYQSSAIHFRVNAEHIMFTESRHADLEMQIILAGTGASVGKNAILSFLVKQIGDAQATNDIIYKNSPYVQIFGDMTDNNWQINLKQLGELIMAKVSQEVFLNIFTYNGTRTYGSCDPNTWFIYGSELYMTSTVIGLFRDVASDITGAANLGNTAATYQNARRHSGTGGGGGEQQITRICYTGYFKIHLADNYGLWFGVGSILLFFIFTLTFGDKPLVDYDFHESVWSIHPLVSIFKYGNEIHTKKTRSSLFLCMITIIGLFASVFYRDASNPKRPSNIIVFAVYAALIDIVITFFVGNMLRGYYLAKYQYHKTKEEGWDQKAQNRIFGFYITVFIIVAVGWPFTVWNMGELHAEVDPTASEYWVASFFVGIALETMIYYPLICILARGSNFIRRMGRSIGFMYDNICHETYMDFLKHD